MSERDPWDGIGEWDPFATHPVKESVRAGEAVLRVGDRVFQTYDTDGRGCEAMIPSLLLSASPFNTAFAVVSEVTLMAG